MYSDKASHLAAIGHVIAAPVRLVLVKDCPVILDNVCTAGKVVSCTYISQIMFRTSPPPPSIHTDCSESLGPSGIFCSLCYCIERLRVERMVDVFQAVQKIQLQRPKMVESMQQYAFVYDCVYEFIRTHSNS